MRLSRLITVLAFALAVQIGSSPGRASGQGGLGCHAAYEIPHAARGDIYDAVMVTRRAHMTCNAALDLAAKAYALPHFKMERGAQFGAGGYGGPFRVGSFHCFLHDRGSDFINAACASGHRYARFYDHRQYFSIPEDGWSPPARRP